MKNLEIKLTVNGTFYGEIEREHDDFYVMNDIFLNDSIYLEITEDDIVIYEHDDVNFILKNFTCDNVSKFTINYFDKDCEYGTEYVKYSEYYVSINITEEFDINKLKFQSHYVGDKKSISIYEIEYDGKSYNLECDCSQRYVDEIDFDDLCYIFYSDNDEQEEVDTFSIVTEDEDGVVVESIELENEDLLVKDLDECKLFSYTGSKKRFKDEFTKILQNMKVKKVDTYIEAFAGSLSSLLHNLQCIETNKVIINDFNPRLINLYKMIQEKPHTVWEGYKMIEDKFESLIPNNSPKVRVYPKDRRYEIEELPKMYKYIRKYINKNELNATSASCILWLLNHQFNGMYNENKKGDFNVSFNWSTKPVNTTKIKDTIFRLSELFNSKNTQFIFENLDVDTLISNYNDHDTFIYLDPPYIDTDIQYNKSRVGKENCFTKVDTHIKMLDLCSKYKYVMYSNNHHEDFVEYFDGYLNFERGHSVSNKRSGKPKKEILSFKINNLANNIDYVQKDEYSISIGTAFSGMGCPEYSLNQLGVNHTSEFVIDNNKFCRETLVKNFNPKIVLDDITKVSGKELPNCDLYVWGSPCQNFSMSSTSSKKGRQGLNGETGVLFWDGYRILKETQPKYSIFENVKGLVNHDKGNTFKVIMNAFKELGNYDIYYKVINPIDIGGNTNRERIFIVLIRKDVGIKFNFPEKVESTRCIKDCLIDGDYKYLNKSEYTPWERSIDKQVGKLRKDFRYLGTKREEQQRVFNINYPCPTIQRSGFVLINDGTGVRLLSPEELKEIQGFGDDLDMSHLSKTQIKSQLGNTMEVETMKQLLGEIVRIDKLHLLEVQNSHFIAA